MSSIIRVHLVLMKRHPWKTVALSTGFVMSSGDAISQKFVERKDKLDYKRYLRYWAFGFAIAGPLFHGWYLRLQTIFGKSRFAPFKMVITDQMLFAPAFPPFFLGVMGIMKGDPLSEIQQKIKNDYLDILTSCWSLWTGVQLLNFLYVPVSHRVLFNNVVALGWDTYLAWKADSSHQRAQTTAPALLQTVTDNPVNQTSMPVIVST
ncbi:protein Mpv17-like [Ostrea edulis]|uniref:protein Mpv17-like n=1 Tax=Ostrea edulis TaxID=37623 RepID=UPI002094FB5D|nr:protein Mpv17-like [Ostrea edulis]